MKKILLSALLSIMTFSISAATYIYNPSGTGVVSVVGNWWTGVGGTGTQLTAGIGFTTAGNTFEIRNSVTIITANWTVSGTGSKVIVGNIGVAGITFTIPSGFAFIGIIDIVNASSGTNTVSNANIGVPTFGSLSNGSTVNYSASGSQTVQVITYQNLILSGSGVKALSSVTVNGKLSMQGTATASVAPTYGAAASLEYNSTSNLTTGPEWITPFVATGGVSITNTGTITLNSDKQMGNNTSVLLQIASGATLNTSVSNYTLTLHGNLTNAGTLAGNASPVIIGGTTATQSIAGFTTTGLVSMTKTAGTATMTGNLPQSGTGSFPFTINGLGGTIIFGGTSSFSTTGTFTVQNGFIRLNNVNLTSPTTHMHQVGDFTITGGTVDFSDQNSTPNLLFGLNVSGNYSKTGGNLQTNFVITNGSGSFGLIQFNGTTQTIKCTTPFTTNKQLTYYVASGSTCTLSPGFDFNLGPAATYESFDVRSGGTLICGATELVKNAGPGFFTLSGTLVTANVNGINSIGRDNNTGTIGSIQTGTRKFNTVGSLEYNGTSAQNTGVFVTIIGVNTPSSTPTLNNLTINNTPKFTGVVTAQQNFTVNGVFAQSNGIFAIGGTTSTPQTLTLNGTITNADDNYDRLRANGYSNLTIGNTGTGGSGPLGYQLFFDQSGKGESKGTSGANDLTILTPGTTNNVRNFTMNRPGQTMVLQTEMQVNNVVNITSGTLASGGSGSGEQENLVLLSTATTTSSVLELVSGASISGAVVVQSYFQGGTVAINRGFRMISSPVNIPTTFFSQMKQRFIITGNGATLNGFDINPNQAANAPTITTYVESGAIGVTSFLTIPNINTSAITGKGYYFFFRGNRSNLNSPAAGKINIPFSFPESWTAAYIGPINSGNVSIAVTKTVVDVMDGINLLGNPYPGTLDFQAFRDDATNSGVLDDYICIMNRNRTGFVTQSGRVTNGTVETAPSGSGGANAGLGIIRYVQPGQGFFVRKTATGSGSVTFKESHKANATNSPNALRLLNVKGSITKTEARKLIRMSIFGDNNRDDATVVMEPGNDVNFGGYDAPYLSNASVVCYTLTADNKPSCINFMPSVDEVDSIRIFVTSGTQLTSATLNFTDITGAGNKEVYLKDNHLGTVTEINSESNSYEFVMDKSNATSFGRSRFVLLFKDVVILSAKLMHFKASANANGVFLKWNTSNNFAPKRVIIERSADSLKFEQIATLEMEETSKNNVRNSYFDTNPNLGLVYYRLRNVYEDGSHNYTETESVHFGFESNNSEVNVYPTNPAKDNINVEWKTNNVVNIVVHDITGKVVNYYGNINSHYYKANVSELQTGIYILRLFDRKNNTQIGVRKFYKE